MLTNNKSSTVLPKLPDINIAMEVFVPGLTIANPVRVLPLPLTEYMSKPYIFKSAEEFEELVAKVPKYKNLEELYNDVKRQWSIFTKFGNEHTTICSADTIFTYLQDKLGMTHYLIFVGDNGSGKSTNLFVFRELAYRFVMNSNMTYANVYSLLGSDKQGAVTIGDNEVTNLDTDDRKMQVYKDGYTLEIPNLRLDVTFGRHQYKLYGYCFKALTLEKLPRSRQAKGLLQRSFVLPCIADVPAVDILQATLKLNNLKYAKFLEDLRILRNSLLIYRMLHYYDRLPELELNIDNRATQLVKPLYQLFHNTKQPLREVSLAVNKYLSDQRENGTHSIFCCV